MLFRSNRWKWASMFSFSVLLFGGCGSIPLMSGAGEAAAYTKPQAMIIAATERNRYEAIYTDKIWDVQIDEEGTDFETYLLEQVQVFLEELKTVTMMAKEQGVNLDGAEREKAAALSKDYYSRLTQEDIDYMGISQEDVQIMYEEYCLANKMVTETTKDMDLEISDSEAKVIVLQQIEVWNRETADMVWVLTQEEGADFEAIAEEYSVNPDLERKLGRGEDALALEEAAFSLAEGEISPVIEVGPAYYIVKCIEDYDMDATQERKQELQIQKKDQVFGQLYNEFAKEHPVDFGPDMWDSLDFSAEDGCTTQNFFQLYHEYFG